MRLLCTTTTSYYVWLKQLVDSSKSNQMAPHNLLRSLKKQEYMDDSAASR